MSQHERMNWIDASKGLAILMVVCLHATEVFQYRLSPVNQAFAWWVLNAVNTACRVGIPLLFMFTGAATLGFPERSMIDRGYFQRICQVLVPLVVWALMYLMVARFSVRRIPTVDDVTGIVSGRAHYHLWFLYALTGLAIVFPILNVYVCATGERGARRLGALVLMTLGISWTAEQMFQFRIEPNFSRGLPIYTGYFVLGYALRNYPMTRWSNFTAAVIYLAGLVACALLVRTVNDRANQFDGRFGDYINPLIMAMSVAAFLLLRPSSSVPCDKSPNRASKVLTSLGQASLGIYVSHVLFLDLAVRLGHKENRLGLRMLPVIAVVPILTILVTAISWGFTVLIQKVPVIRRVV